jgi:DNA-binding CsgD family transcriptional regulator
MTIDIKNSYKKWDVQPIASPKKLAKNNFEFYNNIEFKSLMTTSPIVTLIINQTTSSYEFISDNIKTITGYSTQDFYEDGFDFGMSITDKQYTPYLNKYIIPCIFENIEKHAKTNELNKIKFTYNCKIKRKDGKSIWIQQTVTIIKVDKNGTPLLISLSMIDINNLKKDDIINFSILKSTNEGYYNAIYTQDYSITKNELNLSQREIEVLNLIMEGKSSREVAEKLYISLNTVKTHRKNMLDKTGCKKSTELINYTRGLISANF